MSRHEELRREIDEIDRELMRLFEKRMQVSEEIAQYKYSHDIAVFDSSREKEVIAKNVSLIEKQELKLYGELFIKNLMGLSRKHQNDSINHMKVSQK
ncbi:chorismate mutase [Salinicoccus halitifaciens]|uniref:Monofunctional chorismate mutase n=1 Tax=Salinicoccus halitifaciens TaxID=1073415 RepID=A0ABV2EAB9_9STAP|nr:chorismate mutase [Salinicoccus halitifaciens]MCD2138500.1 chorismate mutase [Salinicoccus halitifaciens]